MKTFNYLVNSWLLALCFLPLGFLLFAPFVYWGGWLDTVLFILLIGFVFSILPMTLSALCLQRIVFMERSVQTRMLVWMAVVCFSIICSSWFISSLIGIEGLHFLFMALPAIAAAILALLMRYRQFRKICFENDAESI